ncbi:hypothetical protein INR49_006469 [Caranx melampygus]|nr:hypothetical protein INR49_006469 [Caranx melampygus]
MTQQKTFKTTTQNHQDPSGQVRNSGAATCFKTFYKKFFKIGIPAALTLRAWQHFVAVEQVVVQEVTIVGIVVATVVVGDGGGLRLAEPSLIGWGFAWGCDHCVH